jgi:hypothetical protein
MTQKSWEILALLGAWLSGAAGATLIWLLIAEGVLR